MFSILYIIICIITKFDIDLARGIFLIGLLIIDLAIITIIKEIKNKKE